MREEESMKIQVDVPVHDIGRLNDVAIEKDDGTSRNDLIRAAIKEYLSKHKK
jgi:metal-responsive CopG/Arc/MetJ family transcriptional regulator